MSQAAEQSTILRFPTERKREFQNPPIHDRYLLVDSSPNVERLRKPAPEPEPLAATPEMGLLIAMLGALPAKQRDKVKVTLFNARWKNPGDETIRRLHHHIGGML